MRAAKETAGRVLLISDAGRVLLVGSRNPIPDHPTVWVAPGGTAEHGETPRQAAARELLEEAGFTVSPEELVGPVGVTEGPDRYGEYFLLPIEDGFVPTAVNPDAAELEVWLGFRWWAPEELHETSDVIWPVELPAVLRQGDALRVISEPLVFVPSIMYDSYMDDVAVSEARSNLAEVIEEARRSGEPVYVTRRGRRVAVILDPEVYERVVDSAEDAIDRRELDLARADDDYVPWDEVKADLGL